MFHAFANDNIRDDVRGKVALAPQSEPADFTHHRSASAPSASASRLPFGSLPSRQGNAVSGGQAGSSLLHRLNANALHRSTPLRPSQTVHSLLDTCSCGGECAECRTKKEAPSLPLAAPTPKGAITHGITPDEEGGGEFQTLRLQSADSGHSPLFTQAIDGGDVPATDGGTASPRHHCAPTGRFTAIPSGTLPARFSPTSFGASFRMNAEFETPIPCTCRCGEYRQFVRGFANLNGTPVVHRLCAETMSPTTWHEDCLTSGGTDLKYGYHSIPFANSRFTNPDQEGGCTFNGFDAPGFPLAGRSSGDRLELHLEFYGQLVDACDGNRELTSSSWTVEGSGVVP